MNRRRYFLITILLLFFSAFEALAENPVGLPVKQILGKEYYVYESKKGDSLYGVAKKFGWNPAELLKLNPDANGSLAKGTQLFYPVNMSEMNLSDSAEETLAAEKNLQSIEYVVKKGETIYGIAREYNLPLDVIYASNPNAKKGVKAGDILILPLNGEISQHSVKSIDPAPKHIMAQNEDKITKNEKKRKNYSYPVVDEEEAIEEGNDREESALREDEKEPSEITSEWPDGISEKEENTDMWELQGIREITDSIRGNINESGDLDEIRIALILDDPNAKKDIDFTRGMLVGLSNMIKSAKKIDLNIIDGRMSTSNLADELEGYEPTLIISTADKAFPAFLADFGNTNNVKVVNVFDLKNDLYEDNPSIIQILPTTIFYSENIGRRLHKNYRHRKLLTVGAVDASDGVGEELMNDFGDRADNISLEDFGSYEPTPGEALLIYSYANKKEEVADFIQALDNLEEIYPGTDIVVVGRSNWITMTDEYGHKFSEFEILIPARVWLDEESEAWKGFVNKYYELFDGYPVRSIPNFAASGYDILNYFIPSIINSNGDLNRLSAASDIETMQSDIELKRAGSGGGLINMNCYLLKFQPSGSIEKILVK